jgi:ribose-phosphate pyrophosphokinase
MISESIAIFSLNSGKEYAQNVVSNLNLALANHEEREFEDGEHKIRSLESVRGKDVYIIQSLYSDENMSVNDKICRLLFFIGSLKDSSAGKITLVVPYLAYARKDRKTKSRDPVTTKYIAQLLEAVGVNHVVTLDVHNLQAYQNSFRCYTDHLEARKLFARYFLETHSNEELVVMSPDAGGMKRATDFKSTLEKDLKVNIPMVFMEKSRSGGVISGTSLIGEVKSKTVIIIDDLISSGTTLVRSAVACKEAGAKKVFAAATHAVFSPMASENLAHPALEKIIITNSIPDFNINQKILKEKIRVLDTAPLIGECIEKLHFDESIVSFLDN